MLHELLISLSGHPSPSLLPSAAQSARQQPDQAVPFLSPSELALLSSLTHLSNLNQVLRSHISLVSSTHPSTVCRAVSTAILSTHLARFQAKILEVERQILQKDAGRVGGYGIVPLSGLVGEFDGWTRRLEWLWEIAQFMLPPEDTLKREGNKASTGADIIDRLRDEAHTGYPDLEETSLDLIKVAETAWLRQLSTWVLYGRLPAFGAQDFFIHEVPGDPEAATRGVPAFAIERSLLPKFVSSSTASSILFIGRSLNHIRVRGARLSSSPETASMASPLLSLLPSHLRHLSSFSSPISPSSLSSAIAAIRLSLSQNTLQQLLPLPKIIEILSLLREFFLLGRGEFAVALISEADERIRSRWRRHGKSSRDQNIQGLSSIVIKEGEVTAVLARTWAALSSFQGEEDASDEKLDLARDLIYLSLSKQSPSRTSTPGRAAGSHTSIPSHDIAFNDFLLSTPINLCLHIPSPLDLFLGPQDLEVYSLIHSYLLSIRRAHLRLTSLWQHSSLRREHPAPLGPPYSNTKTGEVKMRERRKRANARNTRMRRVWAICGAAAFLLAELGGYFQGEVVKSCWEGFRSWLAPFSPPNDVGDDEPDNGNEGGDIWRGSTNNTSSTADHRQPASSTPRTTDDPESLSRAHALYLNHLLSSLLLTSTDFTATLRSFLLSTDHLIALVTRLDRAQQGLDLETDQGVVDALNDYAGEEREAQVQLDRCCERVRSDIREVVARLSELDGERSRGGEIGEAGYVPGEGREIGGVDRLLMKLDFGAMTGIVDERKKGEREGR
jgi:Gamma tubulin complex component N-terminal/Gamma tubulin complex component C-terminal